MKAIFLDRDGTLNRDLGYTHKTEDFCLLPSVKEGLDLLKQAGYSFFIITNQSGLGRGLFSMQDMAMFNATLLNHLPGIIIKRIYFCPHSPEDECACRKPKTKHIDLAVKEFNVDRSQSWVIGDATCDIKMAKDAKINSVLVKTGCAGTDRKYFCKPTIEAYDMLDAAKRIIKHDNNKNTAED
jgi:D-glycero-D-manno-heptose 1,7-bisphosphate phosphatase